MSLTVKIAGLKENFSFYRICRPKKPNNYNEPSSGTNLAHIYELGGK